MNDAWRLCGDEDDLRVSWLGRFTRFLLRRLAMLLVFFCLVFFVFAVVCFGCGVGCCLVGWCCFGCVGPVCVVLALLGHRVPLRWVRETPFDLSLMHWPESYRFPRLLHPCKS